MPTVRKITVADYDDLLASVDAGTPQRELARRYGCAPSLVARHVARARRSRDSRLAHACDSAATSRPHTTTMREILEARIRDPKTSARDLASLVNTLARLDAQELPTSDSDLRLRLLAARRRIEELTWAQFQLPRFMPGVEEWFAALPEDVEDWTELPDAPVELVSSSGTPHYVTADVASFFVERLGWTRPLVLEPDEEVIEEWRTKIAEYDARNAPASSGSGDHAGA
jgi:hypothetical protein